MEEDLNSYFEDPEFKDLLQKYESMANGHTPTYFEAEELTDIAEYYAHIGKEEEAQAAIDYALRLYPNNNDALIFKIRSLAFKGNREEAYRLMDLIEDTSDREVQFLKADMMIDEKRLKEAEFIFEELAANENDSLEILTDITISYMDANLKTYAHKWLKRIGEKGYTLENSQRYRNVWCDFHMTFGEEEKAETAFQISLDKHPYSIPHWNGLAKCYLAQLKIQEAHEAVDFSLAIDAENIDALEVKGYCYIMNKNYESAISIYEKALSINDQKGNLYRFLAQCHLETGRMEDALNCYNQWLKKCKQLTSYEKSEIYGYISMCYCNLNKAQEGMEYINASLELNPFQINAIIQKGTLHLQLGEREIAEEMFNKAMSMSPQDEIPDTIIGITYSYFFLKDYHHTIHWGERILSEYPEEQNSILMLLIYSYFELGNSNRCLSLLEKAKQIIEENPTKNYQIKESLDEFIKELAKRNNNYNFDNIQ